MKEVLLSYRVLFGQNPKAQRLFKKCEYKRTPGLNGQRDPLLAVLCEKSTGKGLQSLPSALWLDQWRDFTGTLLEQDMYSVDSDFSVLGARLLELQDFILKQNAYTIWDIWRDRRNPLQWYTFWAVIIFGFFTLIISVIQTVLSGEQLEVAKQASLQP